MTTMESRNHTQNRRLNDVSLPIIGVTLLIITCLHWGVVVRGLTCSNVHVRGTESDAISPDQDFAIDLNTIKSQDSGRRGYGTGFLLL